jgi:hypothetical protein
MNANQRKWLTWLAEILGIISIGFSLYAWVTEPGVWRRFWFDMVNRPSEVLSFRFMLQPAMAILAAWKDGGKDAATGRAPYLWTVLTSERKRGGRLREGMRATGKILAIGLTMDLIYQAIVLGHYYPFEAAVVAVSLAFLPYLLLRGPIARLRTKIKSTRSGQ